MCPLCIGTAALLASSGASAGGLAALLFRQRARKNRSSAPFLGTRDDKREQKDVKVQLAGEVTCRERVRVETAARDSRFRTRTVVR